MVLYYHGNAHPVRFPRGGICGLALVDAAAGYFLRVWAVAGGEGGAGSV